MLMIIFMNYFIMTISILLSIAFFTMLERKILSYIQIRKGPNKVMIMGLFQPMADALKLFNKNLFFPKNSNFLLSLMSPMLMLLLMMIMLSILSIQIPQMIDSSMNMIMMMIIFSLSVYSILMISWSTNSKYSNLGMIRNIMQLISYEINFFMIILSMFIMYKSFNSLLFNKLNNIIWMMLGLMPMFMLWMILCLSETNRSPFDFAEGESELVSGFNVEYMGALFAMIFLAEYMSIMLLSMISMIMFSNFPYFISSIIMIMISLLFLFSRGSYPRFRFDLLMKINWKMMLPVIISTFMLMFMINKF